MLAPIALILVLASACPVASVEILSPPTAVTGECTTYDLDDITTSRPLAAQDGSVWLGLRDGAVRYDGARWAKYTSMDGLMGGQVVSIVQGDDGTLWFAGSHLGQPGVTSYNGTVWRVHAASEELLGRRVGGASAIDRNGRLWLTTELTSRRAAVRDSTKGGFGVVCFDGESWQRYRVQDGLAHNRVYDVAAAPDGSLWFATQGGVSRFHRDHWTTYRMADGLRYDAVYGILVAQDGEIWCSHGPGSYLSVFDGTAWRHITSADGMPLGRVRAIAQTSDGVLWFGTHHDDDTTGLLRFDGLSWLFVSPKRTFRTGQPMGSLAGDNVWGITQSGDGGLWLVVPEIGLVSYRPDFTRLAEFSGTMRDPADGSPRARVGILVSGEWGDPLAGTVSDADGHFSLPVPAERVYRVLGVDKASVAATTEGIDRNIHIAAGVSVSGVLLCLVLLVRRRGRLWGVLVAPHRTFMGLGDNPDHMGPLFLGLGCMLFACAPLLNNWAVREFRIDASGLPDAEAEKTIVTWLAIKVSAALFVVLLLTARALVIWLVARCFGGHGRFSSAFSVLGYACLPEALGVVTVAVAGLFTDVGDMPWAVVVRPTGLGTLADLEDPQSVLLGLLLMQVDPFAVWSMALTAVGIHAAFEVGRTRAALIYLVYGMLYVLALHGFLGNADAEEGMGAFLRIALGVLLFVGVPLLLVVQWRRARKAEARLMRHMERELQAANALQMGLMPKSAPQVPGFGIAGRCLPASHVGGDFCQYFEREGGLTVSLADVTGHSMEAAIPAVMFSGVLDKQMEFPSGLEERFRSLNRSLCRSLSEHTFVCLAMLEMDPTSRSMRVSSCGCPYPLHYRQTTGSIEEIQVEAYPLGIRPDTEYAAKEVSLSLGDCVVLHSDGFSEATNAEKQLFTFDRTRAVIRQGCSEGLSPEALIERLISEVKAFTGDEPQADDMTCVVVRVDA